MTDDTITERNKQTVITRSASVNSAISLISLINGRTADVTSEEVIELAARIERWIWRGLREEPRSTPTQETPSSPAALTRPDLPTSPAKARPEPAAARSDRPPPRPAASRSNGGVQWGGQASEKHINALFAIAKSKGYGANDLKEKLGKSVMQLTSREASKLIDDLNAL